MHTCILAHVHTRTRAYSRAHTHKSDGTHWFISGLLVAVLLQGLKEACEGKKVFLVAATLRAETMYGQTNCWVSPSITYVVWRYYRKPTEQGAAEPTDELFVTTRRAARNMAYQDMTRAEGDVEIVAEVNGKDLMGLRIKAPMAKYEHVYTLPMKTIAENKGTGIVTSVPSDAPADYAALMDLKKDEKMRNKYGITPEMVEPFEPVPIISTPELGDMAAVKACQDAKVKSQNDIKKLEELKEVVYKQGFYNGTLMCGTYKGQPVQVSVSTNEREGGGGREGKRGCV